MSRIRRYALALFSGYALLAVNSFYTLASVPLALSYLTKAEFGLWALVSQIAGYLLLVDLGVTSASSRILVDYKDDRTTPEYGSVIKTNLAVAAAQSGILLLAGTVLFASVPILWSSEPLTKEFSWLLLGQCALLAVSMPSRVFSSVLWAHQRQDIVHYAEMLLFLVNFTALWIGFEAGGGVYSMLWAQAAGVLVSRVGILAACFKLGLMPAPGCWGRATADRFRSLFGFSKDIFLFALGSQMINTSQTLLVAPLLGLETAGVWAVCTRTFTLANQIVWKILDASSSSLSEMLVRRESDRMFNRFRGVTVLTLGTAALGAAFFAFCNQPFIAFWTRGEVHWPPLNDALLAVWMILVASQRCHIGLLGIRKDLSEVKFIYLAEGILFVSLASIAVARGLGVAGLIGGSIVATVGLSFVYGHRRTRSDFNLRRGELAHWWLPAVKLFILTAGLLWLLGRATEALAPWVFLGLALIVVGPVSAVLLLRECLDGELKTRFAERLPARLRPAFGFLASVPDRPA